MTQDYGNTKRGAYRAALAELAGAQKPGFGVPAYLRWVNRRLGRHIAAAAFVLRLTPNSLSAIGGLLTLVGLLIVGIGPQSWPVAATGALAFLIGYAFDSADGQLARLTRSGSAAGEWLDHVIDAVRQPAFHIAIAVTFTRNIEPGTQWVPAVAVVFSVVASVWFFSQILAEKLAAPTARTLSPSSSSIWISLAKSPYDCSFGYFLILLLPMASLFSFLYVCWFGFTASVAALSLIRKFKTLQSQRPAASVVT